MYFWKNIRNIVLGTFIIAVLVFTFVMIEFYESKNELLNTLKNEATNLSESLSLSFENVLLTNEEVETLLVNKLDAVAALVAHLELAKNNKRNSLSEIVKNFQIDNISVIDKKGKVLVNSDSNNIINQVSESFLKELNPLFEGEYVWQDLGIINNEVVAQQMYLIARIGANNNECVLVGLSSDKILAFRKKIGIGKQIQEIADNPDIIYLLLQDSEGIISASKGIN